MNGASIRPPLRLGRTLRIISGCFLSLYLTTVSGCRSAEPVPEAPAELPTSQPTPPQPPPQSTVSIENALSEPEAQSFRRSGETVWANGFRGELIAGVDGELYEPYSSTTIERVQRALKNRDLYLGPINGVLDAPTMKAIYTFQQAVYSLPLCGVPTPRTRRILEQGSHTDPSS
jgi:putative peptidoglycan binding protein